jgi:1,4-dihydroxy-2-naphthoyl-CoA hydrolase
MKSAEQQDHAERINAAGAAGWLGANGLRITRATRDEVTAEMEIRPVHLQNYGIVHGGVHAGIVETLASIGAALDAAAGGRGGVVGLENHTSFLRAMRSGVLRASAKPLARGRRSAVWEGFIHDESGRLVASGRVRLLVLDPDAEIAVEAVPRPRSDQSE